LQNVKLSSGAFPTNLLVASQCEAIPFTSINP